MLELQGIGGAQVGEQLLPAALIGEDLDVLLGRDALVLAALGTDVEGPLELLPEVQVAAVLALLPRVRRNLEAFALRGAWLSFLLEPGHYSHR